jgi:hypothetical protein
MKGYGLGALLGVISVSMQAGPLKPPVFRVPLLIQAPVDKVYVVREGFDSEDNAQVVIKGTFPNSCYQADSGHAEVDAEGHVIQVSATAFYHEHDFCIPMLVPYIQVVKVGTLAAGEYTVLPQGKERLSSKFYVKSATSPDQDDYLYTPVDSATLVTEEGTGNQVLSLRGKYPHLYQGCMDTKEVKTYLTADNVLVVQPIARILPEEECGNAPRGAFEIRKSLDTPVDGEGLLHVRTLNGNAYNQLVEGR